MRLTVVGCGPAFTLRAGRASSCYLVEHDGAAVLLDLGQGSFSELGRYRPPETLDSILVSHLHPDHLVDLVPLRHYLKYATGGAAVAVHGPAELPTRLDALLGEHGFMAPLGFGALAAGRFKLAGLAVDAGHVTHIPDSYAFRLAPAGGGAGLVYSGDCAVADDLLPLIRPGDVVLCEAALGDGDPGPLHLTAAQAGAAAARADAGRLVLTHILDGHRDEGTARAAAAHFAGPLTVARPGLVVEVG